MNKKFINAKISGDCGSTAYVSLPGHFQTPGIVKRTVRIESLITAYKGPMVNFDFNSEGQLIGIEIIVFGVD